MQVVCFRMVNGDEILGRDEGQDSAANTITLAKVRHLVVQRTVEGLGVTLMPWAFSSVDGDVVINKAHIMATIDPTPETVVSYQQQTTGIALVS